LTLVPVEPHEVAALSRGESAARLVAPGWPHDDTAAGLSFAGAGGRQFLVIDSDDRIAGECGTKTAPRDGIVEIGYGLAAPSRGKGLGSAAVAELVDWLDARDDVTGIEAEVHVSNTPSRRVVERLGFIVTAEPDSGGYLRYRRSSAGRPT
jgi:RimJ/RimL family protein N-acetyltransferase